MQIRNKNPDKHLGRILFLKIVNSLRALYTLFMYSCTFLQDFLAYLEAQCILCSAFFKRLEFVASKIDKTSSSNLKDGEHGHL